MLTHSGWCLAMTSEDWWIGIFAISIVYIVLSFIKSVVRTNARERTRREIAAYIAEGSMSAEQGERLMKAGEQAES